MYSQKARRLRPKKLHAPMTNYEHTAHQSLLTSSTEVPVRALDRAMIRPGTLLGTYLLGVLPQGYFSTKPLHPTRCRHGELRTARSNIGGLDQYITL
jgi:hypothetical protein